MSKCSPLHTLGGGQVTGFNADDRHEKHLGSRSAEGTEPITRGTGNVFADLGFANAAGRHAKLRLAYVLNRVLDPHKLSQANAAKVLGVTSPRVAALRHYKLAGFSIERLEFCDGAQRGRRGCGPRQASVKEGGTHQRRGGLTDQL